jgi:glycosyltransferase involved in cell wall biosynthesis
MNNKITAVIPVLNEEKNIEKVIFELENYCENIIIVNDGSTDNTKEILQKLSETYSKKLLIIENKKNMGIGYSMKVGLKKSLDFDNSIIVKIDGDGQHQPQDLIKFVNKINDEGYEFVKGNRFLLKEDLDNMPLTKLVGNLLVTTLQKLISGKYDISDPNNGFLAIKKTVLENIDIGNLQNNYFFENSLLLNITSHNYSVGEVGIKTIYNDEKSSIPMFRASLKMLPTFLKLLFVKNKISAKYYLSANSLIFFIFWTVLIGNVYFNNPSGWFFIMTLPFIYIAIDLLNFFSNKK